MLTYAALGGVIFLFVAFLQATFGYTAFQAGAATLPITVLLLVLSARSGSVAQRIGPRIPLAVGACLTGVGLLLMSRIEPGDEYFMAVMPSLVVFGVGLAAVITPITATVLATVDSRHAGIGPASITPCRGSVNCSRWLSSHLPRASPAPTSRTPKRWRTASRSQ